MGKQGKYKGNDLAGKSLKCTLRKLHSLACIEMKVEFHFPPLLQKVGILALLLKLH